MIDVPGAQLELERLLQSREDMQQHRRVDASAQSQQQAIARRNDVLQPLPDMRDEIDTGVPTWTRFP